MKFRIVEIESETPSARDWTAAEPYLLRENEQGVEPSHRTELRALYGRTALYLRYTVEDDFILANMTENNASLYEEEAVELFYSPDGNLTRYFELEFNVNQAIFFGLIHNPNGNNLGMSLELLACDGLICHVERNEGGYTVTASIPFAAIGGAPANGARCNAFRIDWFPENRRELNALEPTRCNSFHIPSCFAEIEWCNGRERS